MVVSFTSIRSVLIRSLNKRTWRVKRMNGLEIENLKNAGTVSFLCLEKGRADRMIECI